jgi:hypothetical protein
LGTATRTREAYRRRREDSSNIGDKTYKLVEQENKAVKATSYSRAMPSKIQNTGHWPDLLGHPMYPTLYA